MSKVIALDYEHEHDYELIGINSTLEDYRLAYLLNKNLPINLVREPKDLDFSNMNCSFAFYNYNCEKTFSSWSLLANRHVFISNTVEKTNLFNEESKISYLINEKKEVDFFFKLQGDFDSKSLKLLLERINKIKGVIASFTIDPLTLKSKDFLIY
jgi:hypothetical protein